MTLTIDVPDSDSPPNYYAEKQSEPKQSASSASIPEPRHFVTSLKDENVHVTIHILASSFVRNSLKHSYNHINIVSEAENGRMGSSQTGDRGSTTPAVQSNPVFVGRDFLTGNTSLAATVNVPQMIHIAMFEESALNVRS
ncbi:hypothetical protein C8R43DRAFT_947860 [Mycena crocata]|nr:hypothetical protein C8R43DRAFT_947860 [Mycena crocata]